MRWNLALLIHSVHLSLRWIRMFSSDVHRLIRSRNSDSLLMLDLFQSFFSCASSPSPAAPSGSSSTSSSSASVAEKPRACMPFQRDSTSITAPRRKGQRRAGIPAQTGSQGVSRTKMDPSRLRTATAIEWGARIITPSMTA